MKSKRDFTSAEAKEAILPDKNKLCGNCCWFCHEDSDGWGFCNSPNELYEHMSRDFVNCDMPVTRPHICGYVSRQEMRHHMAVLLREKRWQVRTGDFDSGKISIPPQKEDVIRAIGFAYRYMKVFSEL